MSFRVSLLGGVGVFGRNCAVVEVDGYRLGIDCGVAFGPEGPPTMPHLEDIGRIDAWVITHAHEDHAGALRYAHPAPIFATTWTQRSLAARSVPFTLARSSGPLEVELLPVQHSIPGSVAVVVRAHDRSLVFSGDLRLSADPLVGEETNLDAIARAAPNPLALFCDSTNAGHDGENPGDRATIEPLTLAASVARGCVVVVTFASHLERIAALAEVCRRTRRRLFVLGRGLKRVVEDGIELGLAKLEDVYSPIRMMKSFPRERCLVVVGGTQAEVSSGALRLAHDEHPLLSLLQGDLVIHSARVIPGYESRVDEMLALMRLRGAEVLSGGDGRHVSGHAYAGDLELIHAAIAAPVLVPVHGAESQLESHALLGRRAGLEAVRARDGDTLVFEGERVVSEAKEARVMRLIEGVPR